jgi:hypothetical protein
MKPKPQNILIQSLIEDLQGVRQSCQEVIDGDWQPSAEGFEAMKKGLAPTLTFLRKLLKGGRP